MKIVAWISMTAALLLSSTICGARGTPTSSFVPRGPEPHASLSDKHHSRRAVHGGVKKTPGKAAKHGASKAGSRPTQHANGAN